MIRRGFVGALLATAATALTRSSSKADGIQLVTNHGQIVATGNVNVRQAAGGYQVFDTRSGQWTTIQEVSNGLQVVSTGNVNVDQSAAAEQTVYDSGGGAGSSTCTPGESYQDGNCAFWCSDDCQWMQFCCQDKKKCCK
jgi:hypothetical protein